MRKTPKKSKATSARPETRFMEPYKSKHVAFKGSRGERVLITISVGGGLSLAGSEVEAIADHLADQAMHAIASATYLGAKLNKIEAR